MDLCVLEIALRRRQRELWRKIVKEFEIEQSLNVQVQKWIREGTISEKAYIRARRARDYRGFPNLSNGKAVA